MREQSEQYMLQRLVPGLSSHSLPATIPGVPGDHLGLLRHENLHGAAAERIHNGLSFICAMQLRQDPDLRQQLLTDPDAVSLPVVTPRTYFQLQVRRFKPLEGDEGYVFARTDMGDPKGQFGFYVTKFANGSVVIKKDQHTPEGELAEPVDYGALLTQAQAAVEVYAELLGISTDTLNAHSDKDAMSPLLVDKFVCEAKKETSRLGRFKSMSKKIGHSAVDIARLAVTQPEKSGVGRRLSYRRIALIAGLLPAPGLAEPYYATHIPRSVPIELASDAKVALWDAVTTSPNEKPELLYDKRQVNIQGAVRTPKDGTASSLQFVPAQPEAAKHSKLNLHSGILTGTSPRSVELASSKISPNTCQVLPVDPKLAGQELVLATTNATISQVTVAKTQNNLLLCNTGTQDVSSTNLDLVFDAQ